MSQEQMKIAELEKEIEVYQKRERRRIWINGINLVLLIVLVGIIIIGRI